jgi:hypothetical protein
MVKARYRLGHPQTKGSIPNERKEKMILNLKPLGLVLVAVLAVSAVVASAASAQGKLTSDGPVTLVAEETGGAGSNVVTAFGFKGECPGSIGTGHKVLTEAETKEGKKHELIPSGAMTFTLTPHFNEANHNCKIVGSNFPLTTDLNGCDYVTHIGQTSGGNGTYSGTTDIVCPPGKEIVITIFTNITEETNNKPFCIVEIKPQTGLTGIHGTDTGNGFIDLTGAIEGIHATKTNATGLSHLVLCPNQTTTTAKMDGDGTVRGFNSVGLPTAISLSD